jgi:STE24 endopeptidase
MSSRTAALAALLLLGAALLAAVVVTTPWQPLDAASWVVADAGRDFTSAEMAREQAYRSTIRPPAYLGMGLGLSVSAVLGLTPLGGRLVQAVGRLLGGGWWVTAVVGGVVLALVGRVVTLPFDVMVERGLRRYGISTQTWATWAVDQLKSFAVAAALLVLMLTVLYALARQAPRTWWAWSAAAGALLVVALSFAYPIVFEPIFNKFTSMPAGPLRESMLELAERDGVPVQDVLVADASRRTTALNAYVSGFGSTRRIVVYDTLVAKATPAEVELVVAHELGHAERRDVLNGTLIGALALAASMPLLWLLLSWSPLLRRARVDGAGDPRSVALLLFLVAALTFLSSPITNLVSRRVEARADVHSLDLTADPKTFVDVERRLAVTNLSDLEPNPLIYGLFFTHPSAPERIALARTWARERGLPEPPDLRPGGG